MIMIEVVLTILHVIKVKAIKWYKNWQFGTGKEIVMAAETEIKKALEMAMVKG